jgi:hypothetical protein
MFVVCWAQGFGCHKDARGETAMVRFPRWVWCVIAAAQILPLGGAAPAPTRAASSTFTISGSPMLAHAFGILAHGLALDQPLVHIGFTPTTGAQGFSDACAGRTQMGMSESAIQDGQFAVRPCRDMLNIPLALDGLCIVYSLPGTDRDLYLDRLTATFCPPAPRHLQWRTNRLGRSCDRRFEPGHTAATPEHPCVWRCWVCTHTLTDA